LAGFEVTPEGLAARFQYCQPNECAREHTQRFATEVVVSSAAPIVDVAHGPGKLRETKVYLWRIFTIM
jgi:hypothetical protein